MADCFCRKTRTKRSAIPTRELVQISDTYVRRRPELTALYEVVRDDLETLCGAIDDGAVDVKLPGHAKKELEAYLDCDFAVPRLCTTWHRVVQREDGAYHPRR